MRQTISNTASMALTGLCSKRVIPRTHLDRPAVEANVERTVFGAYAYTGVPSMATYVKLVGSPHDMNPLTAKLFMNDDESGFHVLEMQGNDSWPREMIFNPRALWAQYSSGICDATLYKANVFTASQYPAMYTRGGVIASLCFGANFIIATGSETECNVRPYGHFVAKGGAEAGTRYPKGFTPCGTQNWFQEGKLVADVMPCEYRSGNCYTEVASGAFYDYGVQVSLSAGGPEVELELSWSPVRIKNAVVGDTDSVPIAAYNPCGYAVPKETGSATSQKTYGAYVHRYFHTGDFTDKQRSDVSTVFDDGNRDFWTDYHYLNGFFSGYDEWSSDKSAGTFMGWMQRSFGYGQYGSWANDNFGNWLQNVPFVGSLNLDAFNDARIRTSICAEWSNANAETDLNLISHANILPELAPGFEFGDQVARTPWQAAQLRAVALLGSEDVADEQATELLESVFVHTHLPTLLALERAMYDVVTEDGELPSVPAEERAAFAPCYGLLAMLASSGAGRLGARRTLGEGSSPSAMDDRSMNYGFPHDERITGSDVGAPNDMLNVGKVLGCEGASLPAMGSPISYTRWSVYQGTGWNDFLHGYNGWQIFHPLAQAMTGLRPKGSDWAQHAGYYPHDDEDLIVTSWGSVTGRDAATFGFSAYKPVATEKIAFSANCAVRSADYLGTRYDVNPRGSKLFLKQTAITPAGQSGTYSMAFGAMVCVSGAAKAMMDSPGFARFLPNLGAGRLVTNSRALLGYNFKQNVLMAYAFTKHWAPGIVTTTEA